MPAVHLIPGEQEKTYGLARVFDNPGDWRPTKMPLCVSLSLLITQQPCTFITYNILKYFNEFFSGR